MNHYTILILLIAGCGLLGGLINFFRLTNDDNSSTSFTVSKSLLTGLGASGLVPLFLNTISSDLLTSSETNSLDYFVIGGFCLISAIFSSKFIDSLGDKIIQDVKRVSKEVKDVKEELDNVTTEKELPASGNAKEEYERLDSYEMDIMKSMYETKYTYRSISGISVETRHDREKIESTLEKLEAKEYVHRYIRDNGWVRWKLTEKGREIIAESYGDEDSY